MWPLMLQPLFYTTTLVPLAHTNVSIPIVCEVASHYGFPSGNSSTPASIDYYYNNTDARSYNHNITAARADSNALIPIVMNDHTISPLYVYYSLYSIYAALLDQIYFLGGFHSRDAKPEDTSRRARRADAKDERKVTLDSPNKPSTKRILFQLDNYSLGKVTAFYNYSSGSVSYFVFKCIVVGCHCPDKCTSNIFSSGNLYSLRPLGSRVTQGYMLYPQTGYGYSKCAVSVIRGQHPVLYPLSVDSTCAVSAKYPKYADTFAFLHVAYRIRRRFLYPLYPRLCGVYPRLYAALRGPCQALRRLCAALCGSM